MFQPCMYVIIEAQYRQQAKRQKVDEAQVYEEDDVIFINENSDTSPTATTQVQNNLECKLCKKQAKTPFKGRCQHVCCHECWIMWLESRRECPVCKAPTNLRQLIKIFFQ